jgi:hypothetical protein
VLKKYFKHILTQLNDSWMRLQTPWEEESPTPLDKLVGKQLEDGKPWFHSPTKLAAHKNPNPTSNVMPEKAFAYSYVPPFI